MVPFSGCANDFSLSSNHQVCTKIRNHTWNWSTIWIQSRFFRTICIMSDIDDRILMWCESIFQSCQGIETNYDRICHVRVLTPNFCLILLARSPYNVCNVYCLNFTYQIYLLSHMSHGNIYN